MSIDHLLLIGFGGPARREDVRPFLEEVAGGHGIPPARLAEVERHYELTGGSSPYNAYAQQLFERVRAMLASAGVTLPAFLGLRHAAPRLTDVVRDIHDRKLQHGVAIVLAPHRAYASFGKYVENVEGAKIAASAQSTRCDYLRPWHDEPGFVEAQADRVRGLLNAVPAKERAATHLLFCAHSIPMEMPGRPQYEDEFRRSSQLVAQTLKHDFWSLAYQSRSGPPQQRWLEPDVLRVLRELRDRGIRRVVVVPIGFLFDHTEVLYDLDHEAKDEAQRLGLEFYRAHTVMDHPRFVAMLAALVQEHVSAPAVP